MRMTIDICLIGGDIVIRFLRRHERAIHVIAIYAYLILIVAYAILSLQNGAESSHTSSSVASAVAKGQEIVTGKTVTVTEKYKYNVRKILGHYGFFVLIGFTSAFTYMLIPIKKWISIIIHFSTGLLFALITEFWFQASSKGRSPAYNDVLIDYAGFLTLSVAVVVVLTITHKEKC